MSDVGNALIRTLRRLLPPRAGPDLTDAELLRRFVTSRDEAAFELLVWRHAGLVLHVCRQVLQNEHAVEDAFQATFLVLVRKAGGLAHPERLGNWLHGVAQRTAAKLKVAAARRAAHEAAADPVRPPEPDTDWADMRQALDEELVALPEKYRAPLVMCYLQGLTNEEAARRLGWPSGSMSYRLAPAAIISIAQHANPNVSGQTLACRAQLMACSIVVVMTFSSNRPSIQGCDPPVT